MQITLTPTLTTAKKRQAKAWLIAQLASPELADAGTGMSWLHGGVAIYINGQPKIVMSGTWNAAEIARAAGSGYYTVSCGGYASAGAPSKQERLAVLGGIIVAVDLWNDLAEQYSQAMGRVILDAYQSCCLDMVQAPKPAVKLAFSANKQQVALQYTDEPDKWYLGSGEEVAVDDTWQQVAA